MFFVGNILVSGINRGYLVSVVFRIMEVLLRYLVGEATGKRRDSVEWGVRVARFEPSGRR